jgi:multisubunit Na+/H+ antiporter MnhF subunit
MSYVGFLGSVVRSAYEYIRNPPGVETKSKKAVKNAAKKKRQAEATRAVRRKMREAKEDDDAEAEDVISAPVIVETPQPLPVTRMLSVSASPPPLEVKKSLPPTRWRVSRSTPLMPLVPPVAPQPTAPPAEPDAEEEEEDEEEADEEEEEDTALNLAMWVNAAQAEDHMVAIDVIVAGSAPTAYSIAAPKSLLQEVLSSEEDFLVTGTSSPMVMRDRVSNEIFNSYLSFLPTIVQVVVEPIDTAVPVRAKQTKWDLTFATGAYGASLLRDPKRLDTFCTRNGFEMGEVMALLPAMESAILANRQFHLPSLAGMLRVMSPIAVFKYGAISSVPGDVPYALMWSAAMRALVPAVDAKLIIQGSRRDRRFPLGDRTWVIPGTYSQGVSSFGTVFPTLQRGGLFVGRAGEYEGLDSVLTARAISGSFFHYRLIVGAQSWDGVVGIHGTSVSIPSGRFVFHAQEWSDSSISPMAAMLAVVHSVAAQRESYLATFPDWVQSMCGALFNAFRGISGTPVQLSYVVRYAVSVDLPLAALNQLVKGDIGGLRYSPIRYLVDYLRSLFLMYRELVRSGSLFRLYYASGEEYMLQGSETTDLEVFTRQIVKWPSLYVNTSKYIMLLDLW